MLPKWHILLGAVFSLLLWPVFGLGSLIIFAASLLADFDHYLLHAKMKKDFNLKRAYYFMKKLAKEKSKKRYLFIFHTIEFWAVLLAISFYSRLALLIFTGVAFHMLLDFFYGLFHRFFREEGGGKRAPSLIAYLKSKKAKKVSKIL